MADVTTTERLWSEVVQDADPKPEPEVDYQFSNGRKFGKDVKQ